MTKASNIEAIEKTTGINWGEWTELLNRAGAQDLEHRAIADFAYDKLKDSLENPGWWSQSVAVAYEQHIGRRQPGQKNDGTFESSVSKTLDASQDSVIAKWLELVDSKDKFDGVKIVGEPSASQAEKSRHWGCNLADGTRVNADTYPKSDEKTIFTVTHIRVTDKEAADKWKAYWKKFIEEM